jgi:dipeptidyl-peptidase-4
MGAAPRNAEVQSATMQSRARRAPIAAFLVVAAAHAAAQVPSSLDDRLRAIFERNEFNAAAFGPVAWLDDGARYTTIEAAPAGAPARDIVAYDVASGTREVLVAASDLRAAGKEPLTIEDYRWARGNSRVLLFTNSVPVWRQNTRGDYWVFNRDTHALKKLGADKPPSSLMFAKFSPDGARAAYVCNNDIYVEDLANGRTVRLTKDGGGSIVNGTSDWVNEEEFDLRDGFRWSPDGRSIAYWQFDTSNVGQFTLINDTDTLYPAITRFPYPKPGTTNSAVRIGVVDSRGGSTRWMRVPGDPRDNYLPRMEWIDDKQLMLQHVNRLQNTNTVLVGDAATGNVAAAYEDKSDTWLDVVDDVMWLNDGREFLWISEQDGWRHVWRISRDGKAKTLLTDFAADVISVAGIDRKAGVLYVHASPERATEQHLYRVALTGGAPERVTPSGARGWFSYDIAPNGQAAFLTRSQIDTPPNVELVSLPSHSVTRVLVDNASLQEKVRSVVTRPTEFIRVDIGDVTLDGWMITPRDFDPARKYPVIVFVYGEPASQTVVDRWGGTQALFHRALADEGYVIVSFDNRGTPAPRGAAWRKVVYGTVGDLSSRDQAAAIRAFAASRPFVDTSRIAIWGHSGGGSNTLNSMFRFPDVYKVGISSSPVPDQRLYDTIYQERYMGLPQSNERGYHLGSPINFAEGLAGRLLIIHGSGDDNVHYQGTEKLVNRLIELGKPFDLMVYPNRRHGLTEGKGTRYHRYSLMARFFIDHL